MLPLLQHLSSDDFRTFYDAHGVLKSQTFPILYGGELKPRIYQVCGQHTAGHSPGVPEGTNTLCSLPLNTSPHPAQPSSWAPILLHRILMVHLKTQQVCSSPSLVNSGLHHQQSQGWEFSSTLKEADYWCFSLISPKAMGKQDAQAENQTKSLPYFPVQVRLHHKPSSWKPWEPHRYYLSAQLPNCRLLFQS